MKYSLDQLTLLDVNTNKKPQNNKYNSLLENDLFEKRRVKLNISKSPESSPKSEDESTETVLTKSANMSQNFKSSRLKVISQLSLANIFQISQANIQSLINGITVYISQIPPPPVNHSKDLKFADQVTFSGKTEDLESMIPEAEICFMIQDQIYNTTLKKAYYILSLFEEGTAKL